MTTVEPHAGALDQRITLQQPQTTRDVTGDEIGSWVTVRSVWARVVPLRGREAFVEGVSLSPMDTLIVLRNAPDLAALDNRWRVLHRNKIYDLYSVTESRLSREFLELLAKSGTTDG